MLGAFIYLGAPLALFMALWPLGKSRSRVLSSHPGGISAISRGSRWSATPGLRHENSPIPEGSQPWADVWEIHGLGIRRVAGIPPGCRAWANAIRWFRRKAPQPPAHEPSGFLRLDQLRCLLQRGLCHDPVSVSSPREIRGSSSLRFGHSTLTRHAAPPREFRPRPLTRISALRFFR